MTELIFYGGVGEIGGNKILLPEKEKIFWTSAEISRKRGAIYEEPFLSAREENFSSRSVSCPRSRDSTRRTPEIPHRVIFISAAHGVHVLISDM